MSQVIFPNDTTTTRLVGAVLLEQNDDWVLQDRTMQVEGMTELDISASEDGSTHQITPTAA